MTSDSATIPLLLTAGPVGSSSLNLRYPPQYADEIRTLLDANGIEHSIAAEWASGAELSIEAVHIGAQALAAAGGIGGLAAALASVYKTFVHRHDGKRVAISREGDIDISGFSQNQTEQIIENQVTEQTKRDDDWFRSLGPESADQ